MPEKKLVFSIQKILLSFLFLLIIVNIIEFVFYFYKKRPYQPQYSRDLETRVSSIEGIRKIKNSDGTENLDFLGEIKEMDDDYFLIKVKDKELKVITPEEMLIKEIPRDYLVDSWLPANNLLKNAKALTREEIKMGDLVEILAKEDKGEYKGLICLVYR